LRIQQSSELGLTGQTAPSELTGQSEMLCLPEALGKGKTNKSLRSKGEKELWRELAENTVILAWLEKGENAQHPLEEEVRLPE